MFLPGILESLPSLESSRAEGLFMLRDSIVLFQVWTITGQKSLNTAKNCFFTSWLPSLATAISMPLHLCSYRLGRWAKPRLSQFNQLISPSISIQVTRAGAGSLRQSHKSEDTWGCPWSPHQRLYFYPCPSFLRDKLCTIMHNKHALFYLMLNPSSLVFPNILFKLLLWLLFSLNMLSKKLISIDSESMSLEHPWGRMCKTVTTSSILRPGITKVPDISLCTLRHNYIKLIYTHTQKKLIYTFRVLGTFMQNIVYNLLIAIRGCYPQK